MSDVNSGLSRDPVRRETVHEPGTLAVTVSQLNQLVNRDALTGLSNRRDWDNKLEQVIQSAQMGKLSEKPIVVVMIDVDNFKNYNTEHGHEGGDLALQDVAKGLSDAVRHDQLGIRQGDVVSRWAGDEFAILLIDGDQENIQGIAQRIKDTQGKPISFGMICLTGEEIKQGGIDAKGIEKMADDLLYSAKEKGRNCGVLKIGLNGTLTVVSPKQDGNSPRPQVVTP